MTTTKQPAQRKRLGPTVSASEQVRSVRLRMYAGTELLAKIGRVSSEAIEAAIMALPNVEPAPRKQLGIRTFPAVKEKADRVGYDAVEAAILAIPESFPPTRSRMDAKAKVLAAYPDARVSKRSGAFSLRADGLTLARAASELELWGNAWEGISPKSPKR